MYPSDYGYSVLSSSCTRTTNLGSYNSAKCAGQSWLYGKGYEWTISRYSGGTTGAFVVGGSGGVGSDAVTSSCAARPSFNLESSVKYVSGSGTIENPIRIN